MQQRLRFRSVAIFVSLMFAVAWNQNVSAQNPEGVWRGRWTSSTTGHSGPIRARVTSNGDGTYDARFTGRFLVVIPFTYKTTFYPAGCDGCSTSLTASKKLGPILGSYQMQANVMGNSFQAGFLAGKDSGYFSMQRKK